MSERDREYCMLPPPLPGPPEARRQRGAIYTLAARTAHLLAREAARSFDEGDRDRLLTTVDALVELISRS